jgi:5-methylcytosine-specific restriction endonuclease McrA
MSKTGDPIRSYRWQRLRARVLAEEPLCWICGLPWDDTAPPRSRWYPSVDHVIAHTQGGDTYARSNLRAAHHGCNSRKGDGTKGRPDVQSPSSRRW